MATNPSAVVEFQVPGTQKKIRMPRWVLYALGGIAVLGLLYLSRQKAGGVGQIPAEPTETEGVFPEEIPGIEPIGGDFSGSGEIGTIPDFEEYVTPLDDVAAQAFDLGFLDTGALDFGGGLGFDQAAQPFGYDDLGGFGGGGGGGGGYGPEEPTPTGSLQQLVNAIVPGLASSKAKGPSSVPVGIGASVKAGSSGASGSSSAFKGTGGATSAGFGATLSGGSVRLPTVSAGSSQFQSGSLSQKSIALPVAPKRVKVAPGPKTQPKAAILPPFGKPKPSPSPISKPKPGLLPPISKPKPSPISKPKPGLLPPISKPKPIALPIIAPVIKKVAVVAKKVNNYFGSSSSAYATKAKAAAAKSKTGY